MTEAATPGGGPEGPQSTQKRMLDGRPPGWQEPNPKPLGGRGQGRLPPRTKLTLKKANIAAGLAGSSLRHRWQFPYAGLPDLAYPLHDRDVLVTAYGRICMHRKRINISTVLAGQRLGIKEVDEGIWLVSFMSYDLGFIDLEQKTLQPIDNPFGPRLSPMS